MSSPITPVEVLKRYTEDDANIRLRRVDPVLKGLIRRKQSGTYRRAEALEDFRYIAEGGAKNYGHQFGVNWKSAFPEDVLTTVAQMWLQEFEEGRPI